MTAADEGTLRIRFTDANRGVMTKVFESRSEVLDVSTDPRQQLLVAMAGVTLGQDDLVILEYNADTTTEIDFGLSTIRIPVTILSTATGQKTATYLTHSDFVEADVTLTADTWIEVGAFVVPAQQKLKIGHEIPDNSRIYVSILETA